MLVPCLSNITYHLCSYSYLVNSYISSNKSALELFPCVFKSQTIDNLMISMNFKIVDCSQRESKIVKIYLKLNKWQTYKPLKRWSRRPLPPTLAQQSTSNSSAGWNGQCKSLPYPWGTSMTPILCRACTNNPNSCCEFTGTHSRHVQRPAFYNTSSRVPAWMFLPLPFLSPFLSIGRILQKSYW